MSPNGRDDVPRGSVQRGAKLAGLPLGFAGRTALGLAKRIGGESAELVAQEIQQRTADQVFRVLGELKGGAMKLGQALSIFEAALPPELAGPYRATLTKLQESAPPLPAGTVHRVLAADLGDGLAGRRSSRSTTRPRPRRPSGRCTGRSGRTAGRSPSRSSTRARARRCSTTSRSWPGSGGCSACSCPGLTSSRCSTSSATGWPRSSTTTWRPTRSAPSPPAYAGDPDIYVPGVVTETDHVLVTEWMDGTPLSKIISDGSKEERDRAGILLTRFLFSGPARAGLLHADPHPGNFRLLADGRLGVLDFGAVDRLPDGLPPIFGRLLRIMHDPDPDIAEVERELRADNFLRPGIAVDLDALRAFLAPLAEPSSVETFKFSREWMRERGEPGHRPERRGQHRPQVQPAAVLRADPPGVDRRDRRALPA